MKKSKKLTMKRLSISYDLNKMFNFMANWKAFWRFVLQNEALQLFICFYYAAKSWILLHFLLKKLILKNISFLVSLPYLLQILIIFIYKTAQNKIKIEFQKIFISTWTLIKINLPLNAYQASKMLMRSCLHTLIRQEIRKNQIK